MKLLIAFITTIALSLPALAQDKQTHMMASGAATMVAYGLMQHMGAPKAAARVQAPLVVFAVGLIKELVVDEKVDIGDIEANAVGAAGGMVLPIVFDF